MRGTFARRQHSAGRSLQHASRYQDVCVDLTRMLDAAADTGVLSSQAFNTLFHHVRPEVGLA
jgi:hypothetical protein